ncbi:MAG TPA: site-2 protease family protein [Candidatus Acidoferrales bacterium]|jgi:Zn-dependent protease|nr:site-2 protease family protein [Candidatus Acidoferrales bacterium]
MDANQLADGLIQYLMLIALLTFHEFGHAWTAMMCGDDTAKSQGRVSLNPVVHIDPIGTVLMPLLMIFLPGGINRYMIGWAKPVPVNPDNLRHKKFDDILVTLAGPGMNLILAVGLVGLAKACLAFNSLPMAQVCYDAARLSLLLCFFNLIPIPPLDGSQVMRVVTGMTWEAYMAFAQFGFIGVVLVMQIPQVRQTVWSMTEGTLDLLCRIFGVYVF